MRLSLRSAIKLAAILALIEVIFLGFGMISMSRGNPFRLYDVGRLRDGIAANLEAERRAPPTGWPQNDAYVPRPHPPTSAAICASAWGGSFTFGDDVADADAWPHRLSISLGCQVQNYGVDAYGLDQTFIRLRAAPDSTPLTIVAIAAPMILAGGTSSWSFLDLDEGRPRALMTKPRFELSANELTMIPRGPATVEEILAHITGDMPSRDWTALRFPFSLSVIRAIHRKLRGPIPINELGPLAETAQAQQLRMLAARIVATIEITTRERGSRLALVLIPDPAAGFDAGRQFADLRREIDRNPSPMCIIDPTEELRRLTPAEVITGSGHFTVAGNAAIANAAMRGLRACGFTS